MQRWLVISLVAACSSASDRAPTTHVIEVASFPATPIRELDLLFMIDDTTNGDMVIRLADALESLVVSLAAPDTLPNLHIGVATSDLGTSGSLDPGNPGPAVGAVGQGGCAGQGDDGALQLSGADVTGPFVIDEDDGAGGRLRNYAFPLHLTLGQMVRVGVVGCGFEQPLSAIRRALARDTGFLRPAASLAIVILADEDDCSVRDAGLFDPAAPLGPLQSFRCTSQGIECDEPMTEVGAKTNCRPRADSPYLEDPSITRQFLEELKPRPDMLTVSALVGPPTPFAIELRQINGEPHTTLAHGCGYNSPTGPTVADPAVRTAALVEAFGSRGVRETACQLDYAPSLARISLAIKRSLGVACIETSQLADGLEDPGIQPACEARDVRADGTLTTLLPRCPAAGDCFEIVADPAACPETGDHARIVVTRTQPPPEGTRVEVYCVAPLPQPVPSLDAGVSQAR